MTGDPLERWRGAAVVYLGVQAALTVAWWIGLQTSPAFRGWFELDAGQARVLDAFVVADVAVFAGGSLVAAVALARRSASAGLVAAITAGGAAYATLYLAAWVVGGGHGWIGLVPMTVATLVTLTIAIVGRTGA